MLKREGKKTNQTNNTALNTTSYTKLAAGKWNVTFPSTTLEMLVVLCLHHFISLALDFHKTTCLILEHLLCIHNPVLATRRKKRRKIKKWCIATAVICVTVLPATTLPAFLNLYLQHALLPTVREPFIPAPPALPGLALGKGHKSTTAQLVLQRMLGGGASRHVLPWLVTAHCRSPLSSGLEHLVINPPRSFLGHRLDSHGRCCRNHKCRTQALWEVSALKNAASEGADAEVAPNGVKHIPATTLDSHLEMQILRPKCVMTESIQ